jgi:L,D-peptidoglycan transpeptidase YkuD (ErfK/YbiS/YcfS/YnhG family)
MMKVLLVKARADGPLASAEFGGKTYDCVVGKTGVIAASDKREGDSKTPLGRFRLVEGFYRPDRVEPAGICDVALDDGMGWCDAPGDLFYNNLCPADYDASHEQLWLPHTAYDYIGVMDYNLDGKVAEDGKGRGSAIFLHVWHPGIDYTLGCVALRVSDLQEILDNGCDGVEVTL